MSLAPAVLCWAAVSSRPYWQSSWQPYYLKQDLSLPMPRVSPTMNRFRYCYLPHSCFLYSVLFLWEWCYLSLLIQKLGTKDIPIGCSRLHHSEAGSTIVSLLFLLNNCQDDVTLHLSWGRGIDLHDNLSASQLEELEIHAFCCVPKQ